MYTDFDKLQFALKKCFRFETLKGILDKLDKKENDEKDEKEAKEQKEKTEEAEEQNKQDLENRLRQFYHWRGDLLLMLNKFSDRLGFDGVLYHGVNAKMVLNPTETMSFFGPLSTTSSYHVV